MDGFLKPTSKDVTRPFSCRDANRKQNIRGGVE